MLVCICNGVNEDDINEALASGACSVDDIKSETKACTQCGKCEKMVTRMIHKQDETLATNAALVTMA